MENKVDRMLQFFQYKHLPANLQVSSKPFCELAERIVNDYPMNPERTVCLRKLLEARMQEFVLYFIRKNLMASDKELLKLLILVMNKMKNLKFKIMFVR